MKKKLFLCFIGLYPLVLFAQFLSTFNYGIETGINMTKGKNTPFWLMANKQGLSSLEKSNGYVRGMVNYHLKEAENFAFDFGIDVVGAYHHSSNFIFQQIYAEGRYRSWKLLIGSKERQGVLKNQLLSSGGMTFSGNSLPIPQVRIELAEYVPVPTKKINFRCQRAYCLW